VVMHAAVLDDDSSISASNTLSLHDALPISLHDPGQRRSRTEKPVQTCFVFAYRDILPGAADSAIGSPEASGRTADRLRLRQRWRDRKSTRLNSSHVKTSYAVFCLKNNTNDR